MGGQDIDPADAGPHIAGFMGGQDISNRKVQFAAKPPLVVLGKSFDTFVADGDVITTIIEGVGTLVNRCRWVSGHTAPGDTSKGSTS